MPYLDIIICDKCQTEVKIPRGSNNTSIFSGKSPKVMCDKCFAEYMELETRIFLVTKMAKDRFWTDKYPYLEIFKENPL